jgi:hypothetical protein
MSPVPVAEHDLLSDCGSAALVTVGGSVDWLCLPRFDSLSGVTTPEYSVENGGTAHRWTVMVNRLIVEGTQVYHIVTLLERQKVYFPDFPDSSLSRSTLLTPHPVSTTLVVPGAARTCENDGLVAAATLVASRTGTSRRRTCAKTVAWVQRVIVMNAEAVQQALQKLERAGKEARTSLSRRGRKDDALEFPTPYPIH